MRVDSATEPDRSIRMEVRVVRLKGFVGRPLGPSNCGQWRISQCTIQVSSHLAAKKSCGYALVGVDKRTPHIELFDRVPWVICGEIQCIRSSQS
jgi:hypothetical protein